MKLYELTYLISPELSEEELKTIREKIGSLIQNEGGTLIKESLPIKKRLAYPINKKEEAFLVNINFHLTNKQLSGLEKDLKQESKILRYLILAKPFAKITKRAVPRVKPRTVKPKPKSKVELKEIEKKLEEILEE